MPRPFSPSRPPHGRRSGFLTAFRPGPGPRREPRHRAAPPARASRRPLPADADGARGSSPIRITLSAGPVGLVVAGIVLLGGSGALNGVPGLELHGPLRDGAAPAAAAIPTPVAKVSLPAGIEPLSPYEPQVSCDPVAMKGSVALGDLLRATYPGTSYGVARACWSDGITSEHYEGRAVDWMISVRDPAQAARANAVIDWLLRSDAQGHPYAMARRLGVMYLIWNNRIWGAYRASEGWRPYSTCASHPEKSSDTTCHRDHIHISLSWAGATGATSFWTGRVAPTDYGPCVPTDLNWAAPYSGFRGIPCPVHSTVTAPAGASSVTAALFKASGAWLAPGSQGPLVATLQRALAVTADGDFGPMTGAAVSAFRRAHGLAAGQVVDFPTWRALLKAAGGGALPKPSPSPTPKPTPTPSPSPTPTPSPTPSPTAPGSTAGPLAAYTGLVLAYGDRGAAVKAVQKLLGLTSDGVFGPMTLNAVRTFQRTHGVPVTGNVGPLTWAQLSRVAASALR